MFVIRVIKYVPSHLNHFIMKPEWTMYIKRGFVSRQEHCCLSNGLRFTLLVLMKFFICGACLPLCQTDETYSCTKSVYKLCYQLKKKFLYKYFFFILYPVIKRWWYIGALKCFNYNENEVIISKTLNDWCIYIYKYQSLFNKLINTLVYPPFSPFIGPCSVSVQHQWASVSLMLKVSIHLVSNISQKGFFHMFGIYKQTNYFVIFHSICIYIFG